MMRSWCSGNYQTVEFMRMKHVQFNYAGKYLVFWEVIGKLKQ